MHSLKSLVRRTPLLELEKNIFGKAENLQTGGAYKIRGVVRALESTAPACLSRGIATVSAGNLGRAVAMAASVLQVPARIYVPDSTPELKKRKISRLGAHLVPLPFPEIWDMVMRSVPDEEMHFLHPCYEEKLQEGYGSLANEILDDQPDIDVFVIPYGLGSLFLGVATAIKKRKKDALIFACEIDSAAPLHRALKALPPAEPFRRSSLVDAIGTPALIPRLFERNAALLEGSVLVGEEDAIQSIKFLHNYGLVVEGAAAVAYAAAKQVAKLHPHRKIACVLSGGNIDREKLISVLTG